MINHPLFKKIVIAIILIIIGIFIYVNFSIFSPILLALFSAILFEPFVKLFQKYIKTEKRLLPVTIFFAIFVTLCSLITYLALTKLISQVTEWVLAFPRFAADIQLVLERLIDNVNLIIAEVPQKGIIIEKIDRNTQSAIDKAYQFGETILSSLTSLVQAIPNTLFITLVYLITLFLFSLDLPRIINMFYQLFKQETADKFKYVFHRLGKVFLGYWKAQFLLSIMIFVITYVCLLFIAPDQSLMMTVVIWVVDIIPLYVGPALILAPWAIITTDFLKL